MMSHPKQRTFGITLIEALIALAVIGLGILALSKLYGDLMVSTADSKARAEAVQVMESRIDNMRDSLTETDFNLAKDALTEGFTGTNANFRFELDEGTINSLDGTTTIELTAFWDNARDEEQSVQVASVLYWTDPLLSLNQARGRLPGGNSIASPSGEGRTDTPPIDPEDATRTLDLPDDRGIGRLEMREIEGDRQQLVRVDGDREQVMLETDYDQGFSTISGLLIRGDNFPSQDNFSNYRARVDSGYCINNDIGGFSDDLEIVFFRCYVGAYWYENIAIRDSQIDVTDQITDIFTGDPEGDTSGAGEDPLITEPAESIRRAFRGSGIWPRAELGMHDELMQRLLERDSAGDTPPDWLPPDFETIEANSHETVERRNQSDRDYDHYFDGDRTLIDFGQHFVATNLGKNSTIEDAEDALKPYAEALFDDPDKNVLENNAGPEYRFWCNRDAVECPGFPR